jgi:hypothetical protein
MLHQTLKYAAGYHQQSSAAVTVFDTLSRGGENTKVNQVFSIGLRYHAQDEFVSY